MEAIKAREISETHETALNSLLYSIRCNAKNGLLNATFSKKERVIREQELKALQKLGYTVIRESEEYITFGW